ncbi:MAG: CNNM domain-containing protein, partial [Alphaproteobacteria bacterium]|nr:CNNM domain-containing protein [Alphaproteobacteria bacterium]
KPRMLTLENEGSKRAALVNRILKQPDLLIGAILVGYNVINVVSSALTTAAMIDVFGEAGLAYATAIMSVLIVLFVEILPKTIALQRPDSTAIVLAPLVQLLVFVLIPITTVCRGLINAILKPFKLGKHHNEIEENAEQEIRGVIDMHAEILGASQATATMLHAVVDLKEMTVADVMTHRRDMISIAIGQPTDKLIKALLDAKHSQVPLWGKTPEDIVGVIDARRLISELAGREGNAQGIDIANIVAPPWFIPDTTGLLEQLNIFRQRGVRVAFVVDEYGVLQGMLTLADILEEIVGHYDKGQFNALAVPKPQPDGSIILDGRFPIRELNREMGWELSDENATTIAGFIINVAERIPEPGETIYFDPFAFQILARKQKQISKVRIRIRKITPA